MSLHNRFSLFTYTNKYTTTQTLQYSTLQQFFFEYFPLLVILFAFTKVYKLIAQRELIKYIQPFAGGHCRANYMESGRDWIIYEHNKQPERNFIYYISATLYHGFPARKLYLWNININATYQFLNFKWLVFKPISIQHMNFVAARKIAFNLFCELIKLIIKVFTNINSVYFHLFQDLKYFPASLKLLA